jgi:hypothetical protein
MLFQRGREGTEERMDENVRLDAFLINGVTGKIACLKSVWLPCMYDRKIDCSWRKESGRDEKRKNGKPWGRKTEECEGGECKQVN